MREPRLGLDWRQGGHVNRTRGWRRVDTDKYLTAAWQLPRSTPTGLESLSRASTGKFWGWRRSGRYTGHEVETKPPQPQYGYKAARRPKATYQDCFSTGRDIDIKHPFEVCRQDYKFLAQLLFTIKL